MVALHDLIVMLLTVVFQALISDCKTCIVISGLPGPALVSVSGFYVALRLLIFGPSLARLCPTVLNLSQYHDVGD